MATTSETIQLIHVIQNFMQRQFGEPPLGLALTAEPGYPSLTRIAHRVCSSCRSLLPEPVKRSSKSQHNGPCASVDATVLGNCLALVEGMILGTR